MKRILFLLILLIHMIASAQKTKPTNPSSAKQAQTELEKELKELAKDDPEMAKQVREMMKQKQPVKPVTKPIVQPKFVSPVTQIPVKQPFRAPSADQAKDHFLWFKGKKINDSILALPNGSLVLFSRKTNKIVVKPDSKKDPIDNIAKELAKTGLRKTELIDAMYNIKNSFFMYPLLEASLAKYDEIAEDYTKALKNSIEVPLTIKSAGKTGLKKLRNSGTASSLRFSWYDYDIGEQIRAMYRDVLALKENAPPVTIPIPPSHDFDVCFTCDSSQNRKYRDAKISWNASLYEYEQKLHQKAVYLLRNVDYYPAYLEKGEPEKMEDDMFEVKMFLIERLDKKIEGLMELFGNDMSRVEGIIHAVLEFKKQKRLLGADSQLDEGIVLKLKELIQTTGYVEQQIRNKNYHIMFMLPFILGLDRQKALMAETGEGDFSDNNGSFIVELSEQLEAFNRFKLTMEMEFDVAFLDDEEKEEVKANGKMSTASDIYVSLGVNDCKYQLFLKDLDYRKENEDIQYWIPFKISGGTKSIKIDDKWATYSYSGPNEGVTLFQPCRISFCYSKKAGSAYPEFDSLYVQLVRYKDANLEQYKDQVANGYSIDFLGFANNMYFTPSQLESNEEMKDLALEWMQAATNKEIDNPSGNVKQDKMKWEYNMIMKQQDYQLKMSQMSMMPKTLIQFDARNGDNVLIDAQVDTAHKDEKLVLKKGIIKIKVVHDPLPYTAAPKRKPLKNS